VGIATLIFPLLEYHEGCSFSMLEERIQASGFKVFLIAKVDSYL
jgi:hypothetical protein